VGLGSYSFIANFTSFKNLKKILKGVFMQKYLLILLFVTSIYATDNNTSVNIYGYWDSSKDLTQIKCTELLKEKLKGCNTNNYNWRCGVDIKGMFYSSFNCIYKK
jgi:hypothetical protein